MASSSSCLDQESISSTQQDVLRGFIVSCTSEILWLVEGPTFHLLHSLNFLDLLTQPDIISSPVTPTSNHPTKKTRLWPLSSLIYHLVRCFPCQFRYSTTFQNTKSVSRLYYIPLNGTDNSITLWMPVSWGGLPYCLRFLTCSATWNMWTFLVTDSPLITFLHTTAYFGATLLLLSSAVSLLTFKIAILSPWKFLYAVSFVS